MFAGRPTFSAHPLAALAAGMAAGVLTASACTVPPALTLACGLAATLAVCLCLRRGRLVAASRLLVAAFACAGAALHHAVRHQAVNQANGAGMAQAEHPAQGVDGDAGDVPERDQRGRRLAAARRLPLGRRAHRVADAHGEGAEQVAGARVVAVRGLCHRYDYVCNTHAFQAVLP